MHSFSLRQLEIFAAVVECGSFTGAADRLYLAQSTVSENVQALEEALHASLLRRGTKRRLTLTADGRRVYRHAQDNYLSSIRLDPQIIRTVAYVSDPAVLQRLVAEGAGVSILSSLAVREAVAAGRLLQFELDEQPVRRSIYMARRKKSTLSAAASSFAELVRELTSA